jgi:hypothetical protein
MMRASAHAGAGSGRAAALTLIALVAGLASCGSADPAAAEYTVHLDVHYEQARIHPPYDAVPLEFSVDYRVEADLTPGAAAEPSADGTLAWAVRCYDLTGTDAQLLREDTDTEVADFDVPLDDVATALDRELDGSGWGQGPAISLMVVDERVWVVHRLPAAAAVSDPPEPCQGDNLRPARILTWGAGWMTDPSVISSDAGDTLAEILSNEPVGKHPAYFDSGDDHSGWVIRSIALDRLGRSGAKPVQIHFSKRLPDPEGSTLLEISGTVRRG